LSCSRCKKLHRRRSLSKMSGSETKLRRQLRFKNGVAALSSSTSVIRFSVVPTGSFGFITPKLLGMALITRSPDLSLEQIQPVLNAVEIHKLADGSGIPVEFVETSLCCRRMSGRGMPGSGAISIPRTRLCTSLRCLWPNWLSIGCQSDSTLWNQAAHPARYGFAKHSQPYAVSNRALDRPLISYENPLILMAVSTGATSIVCE